MALGARLLAARQRINVPKGHFYMTPDSTGAGSVEDQTPDGFA